MTNFYTYVFLDPLKPGRYVYGEYVFDHEPFYVGKGKRQRAFDFVRSHHVGHKITFLQCRGKEPIIRKVHEELTERDAYEMEKKLIFLIGRRDERKGPLTNLSDGGKAGVLGKTRKGEKHHFFGKSRSEATRKKIANKLNGNIPWNKGLKNHLPKEVLKKMRDSHRGYEMPERQRNNISKANKNKPKPIGFEKHLLGNNHSIKNWLVVSPNGSILTIKNLTEFCKSENLSYEALRQTMYTEGKHRGFGIIEKTRKRKPLVRRVCLRVAN